MHFLAIFLIVFVGDNVTKKDLQVPKYEKVLYWRNSYFEIHFISKRNKRSQNCNEDYFILLLTCWNFLAKLETHFYKLHSPVYLSHAVNKEHEGYGNWKPIPLLLLLVFHHNLFTSSDPHKTKNLYISSLCTSVLFLSHTILVWGFLNNIPSNQCNNSQEDLQLIPEIQMSSGFFLWT